RIVGDRILVTVPPPPASPVSQPGVTMWRARSQSPTDLTLRGAAWRTQPPGRWLSASPRRSSSAGRSTPTSFVRWLRADAGGYHGWAMIHATTLLIVGS